MSQVYRGGDENIYRIPIKKAEPNRIESSFYPLGEVEKVSIREEVARRQLLNILDSCQDNTDLLGELTQNAADSVEFLYRSRDMLSFSPQDKTYSPQIWVILDLDANEVQVIDNGPGISEQEARSLLYPGFTMKNVLKTCLPGGFRGHKGVGLSFVAFAYNYIRISSRGPDGLISFEMVGGRDWVHSNSLGSEPIAHPASENSPIFIKLATGTAVTVKLDANSLPSSLSRLGLDVSKWAHLLRTRTSLGYVDLAGKESWQKRVRIHLIVRDSGGREQRKKLPFSYSLPSDVDGLDFLDLKPYFRNNPESASIPQEAGQKDGIYRTWNADELTHRRTGLLRGEGFSRLRELNPRLYGFFTASSRTFDLISEKQVKDRRMRAFKPGLWVAAHHAPLGRAIALEPAYAAGNAERFYCVIEVDDLACDVGRKVFPGDVAEELRRLGLYAMDYFVRNRVFLKSEGVEPGAGPRKMTLSKRIREAEDRRDASTMPPGICLAAEPINEPEVISLFSELIGRGVFLGYRQLGCYHSAIYDGVWQFCLEKTHPGSVYSKNSPLGLPLALFTHSPIYEYPPFLLEYKVSLDSLIFEFGSNNSQKTFEDITMSVVWSCGSRWMGDYNLLDLTEGTYRGRREFHGATHVLSRKVVPHGHVISVIELKKIVEMLKCKKVRF